MPRRNTKITGLRQLGEAIGRSHVQAGYWVKHPEWPFGPGPWDVGLVPKMIAWGERVLEDTNPDSAPKRSTAAAEQKAINLRLKNAKLKVEIAELMNQFHRADECELRRRRQILAIKNRLFGELPGLALPADHIQIVRDWLSSICEDFARGK